MKPALVIVMFALLALFGATIAFSPSGTPNNGENVYAMQRCALCHSIAGVGGKRMALDGVGSRLKPDEIEKWIRTPRKMKADTTMKPYPNLPRKSLDDLIAYLMTLR